MPNLKGRECTGCAACAATCPLHAIAMVENAEGFSYPVVDFAVCVECGKCEKACSASLKHLAVPKMACAFSAGDENILSLCASGGAFFCIALRWLERGGVAFAVSECGGRATFREVRTRDELRQCAGSKYYQAMLSPQMISHVVELADSGQKVLFAGTPCQVASLASCATADSRANMLLIDLVCQGVPSWKAVQAYRAEAGDKHGSRVTSHVFRAKDPRFPGGYVAELRFADGDIIKTVGAQDYFSRGFMYNFLLRESCYACGFSTLKRIGDITIGDFWGYPYDEQFKSGLTSLVLCNTDKGEIEAKNLEKLGSFLVSDISIAKNGNVPLRRSVKRPLSRGVSYRLIDKLGFSRATRLCAWKYAVKRIIRKEGLR